MNSLPNDVNPKDWDQLVLNVNAQMAEYVSQYMTPLSYLADDEFPELKGSAVFLKLSQKPYLLSCEHVVRHHIRGKRLAYLINDDYFFMGDAILTPEPLDLALAPVMHPDFYSGNKNALPIANISDECKVDFAELFFLGGFPGARSRYMPFDGSLHTMFVSYTTRPKPLPQDPRFISDDHFALEYNFEAKSTDGSHTTLPIPGGFSGSPIWDTGFLASGYGQHWNPSQARLVGIAWFWDQSSSVIVATKATKIREFLLHAIREEAIVDHWYQRGRPNDNRQPDIEYALKHYPQLS